ncbi:MAG: hypothetical protein WCI21_01610 [Alphaproteobacteria bacterium]
MGNVSSNWPPFDPKGLVFLGRAAHEAGRARFGATWTGAEPDAIIPAPIPHSHHLRSDDYLKIVHLIPEERRISLVKNSSITHGVEIADEDLTAALDWSRAEIAKKTAEVERWSAVKVILAEALAANELPYRLKSPDTGGMFDGQPEWWNVSNWPNRFQHYQMSPTKPNSASFTGHGFLDIFLVREPFDALVERLAHERDAITSADWWPAADHLTCTAWCVLPLPDAEARTRAKAKGEGSEKGICRELAKMWNEAGRGKISAASIEQFRRRHREALTGR